jgi:dTDP-4-amino-4,6-dideoxygalactose transaminase
MSVSPKSVAVPALDLKAQYQTIRDEIDSAIRRVVESQMFIQGPEVERLENEVAEYCGAARAIGCASGTDALLLPLMALAVRPVAVHVLRHRWLDLAARRPAGLRRHPARHL